MSRQWLMSGDRVRVVRPLFELERQLLGRELTIVRFAKPHGHVVCVDESGAEWHLHPEALDDVLDLKEAP